MTTVLVTGAVTTPLAPAAVTALQHAGVTVAGPYRFGEAAVAVAGGELAPDAAAVLGAGADSRRDAYVLAALGVPVIAAGDEHSVADLSDAVSAVTPPAGGGANPIESDQLRATVAWLADDPLLRGRSYTLRHRGGECAATVAPIKHRLDLETLEPVPATRLAAGEVGECELELDAVVTLGGDAPAAFVLHDRVSGAPAGVGIARFALRRASNLRWQETTIDAGARAEALGQRPGVVWLTGLSGAGKSTIANRVEALLHASGRHTYMLDGDNVRHGLNRDLGFTDADRVENIRRVAEVARLMADAGLIVLVSFISPFRSERAMARELMDAGAFYEVFIDTPLSVAEARDPKGLYAKARRGELANFTGIDSAYEPPERPELRIDTTQTSPEDAALAILALLDRG